MGILANALVAVAIIVVSIILAELQTTFIRKKVPLAESIDDAAWGLVFALNFLILCGIVYKEAIMVALS